MERPVKEREKSGGILEGIKLICQLEPPYENAVFSKLEPLLLKKWQNDRPIKKFHPV
jgi:hypothetical protein